MRTKFVTLFSGGMDSTALLYHLIHRGIEVYPVMIDYGQRHRKEIHAAQKTVLKLGLEWEVADVAQLFRRFGFTSSLTSDDVEVPEGHYEEESMKATVVPNRNMIFLSIAAAVAVNEKADGVAIAVHGGDHAIYPDCRPEFIEAMATAVKVGNYHPVEVLAPFLTKTKEDIARMGYALGVPWEQTWSCYKGGQIHCGRCGTCVERREALVLGAQGDRYPDYYDTTKYEDPDFWKTATKGK